MLGANMGYQPYTHWDEETEKYAWIPIRTTSKKWVWREKYYKISAMYRNYQTSGCSKTTILTLSEYILYLVTKPEIKRITPPLTR